MGILSLILITLDYELDETDQKESRKDKGYEYNYKGDNSDWDIEVYFDENGEIESVSIDMSSSDVSTE
ncbi:MAG: hypothetical protein ACOCRK_11465 [bacterium]